MSAEIPRSLQQALESCVADFTPHDLNQAFVDLSARYREKRPGSGPVARSPEDVAAYAAYRFPATYAAIHSALSALKEQRPGWEPRSLLDLGAGLGAGLWAARDVWPSIEHVTALDAEPAMIVLGRRIVAVVSDPVLQATDWRHANLNSADLGEPCDLILIGYVLGEVEPARLAEIAGRAWQVARGALVVVEPGTPEGYRRVCAARDAVRDQGGFAVAPCPHDPPCDVSSNDWIHFSVRLSRSKLHREAKGAELSYEDEKYAYVALSHTPAPSDYCRVLRHPQIRKGHVHLLLCTPAGIKAVVISKREGELYKRARKANWGDVFDLPEERYAG